MKPTLLFLAATFILSSCTQYQYLTVSGENIAKNEKNEFVSENDTLKVQYHFTDYKGKVGITLYNKSSQPLEMDWKKSAVILDGKAYSYYNANLDLAATATGDTLAHPQRFKPGDPVYVASLNGSIFIEEPSQFIPPASFIYKEPLVLPVERLEDLPDTNAKNVSLNLPQSAVGRFKRIYFEKGSSPLRFRSYLTLRIGSGTSQKEFAVEHSFYVSEIWRTAALPEDFPTAVISRGDRFYLQP